MAPVVPDVLPGTFCSTSSSAVMGRNRALGQIPPTRFERESTPHEALPRTGSVPARRERLVPRARLLPGVRAGCGAGACGPGGRRQRCDRPQPNPLDPNALPSVVAGLCQEGPLPPNDCQPGACFGARGPLPAAAEEPSSPSATACHSPSPDASSCAAPGAPTYFQAVDKTQAAQEAWTRGRNGTLIGSRSDRAAPRASGTGAGPRRRQS